MALDDQRMAFCWKIFAETNDTDDARELLREICNSKRLKERKKKKIRIKSEKKRKQ